MGRPRKGSAATQTPDVDIFFGADESWHGFITVGTLPDGSPDRRHRMSKDENRVITEILKLQEALKAGRVPKAGKTPKVSVYLTDWLTNPLAEWRYSTQHNTYDWAINKHIIPGLGNWQLDLLNEKHIETFLRGLYRTPEQEAAGKALGIRPKGLSDASVHAVFRVLRAALNDAVRRRLITSNPIDFMEWRPKNVEIQITPYFVQEVQAILDVCLRRRNGSRWVVGLCFGLRQGEALGLPWWIPPATTRDIGQGLDLETQWLTVGRKAERRKWQHGCDDPAACAAPHCKTKPCPKRWQHGCGKPSEDCTKQRVDRCPKRKVREGCATHKDPETCAKVCPPGCVDHARLCPKRAKGGIVFTDPKTDAGFRRISIAVQMMPSLFKHRDDQDRERIAAGGNWEEHGLVWCQDDGSPIDARDDWEEWKVILVLAGVRDGRVHDGRHTAATLLLLLGVDEITVMAIMGWSDRRMLRRYQHVIDELRQRASASIGNLLFGPVAAEVNQKAEQDAAAKEAMKEAVKEAMREAMEEAKAAARAEILQQASEQGEVIHADFSREGFATDHATDLHNAKIIRFPASV